MTTIKVSILLHEIRNKLEKEPPKNGSLSKPKWSQRSWQGAIIRAIVQHNRPLTWKEIQDATGLDEKSMNKALRDLHISGIIYKSENSNEFNGRYQIFDGLKSLCSEMYNPKTVLLKWIGQWKGVKNLGFSDDSEHFFLERRYLDDFSKEVISHASYEVLIANPYIQECDLSNTIRDAKRKGIKVTIITRPPTEDKYPEYVEKKRGYHLKLKKEGVAVFYDPNVHAKMIIVDQSIAIVSSMNFYAESSAGVSWEAGMVTTNANVVRTILDCYSRALADSPNPTETD